jgi:hypothetical protein
MMAIKAPPRFLPTLTEVIQPPAELNPLLSESDTELLVETVLQTLVPRMQEQLQGALQQMVQEQMQLLIPRLQQEVETAIRQAILQAKSE